ncbi:hypothetical protein BH09ACT11_BH09ACT11_01590 [soil metagenome]
MSKQDPGSLEAEIEEARERLATTIDQLLYRANPKTIAGRRAAAAKAVYIDPETGRPKSVNIAKTVGVVAGAVAVVWGLKKIRARSS